MAKNFGCARPEWLKTFFKVFSTPTLLACLSATGVCYPPARCGSNRHSAGSITLFIIPIKNTTFAGGIFYWCAILCEYRTEDYGDYKHLVWLLFLFCQKLMVPNPESKIPCSKFLFIFSAS